MDLNRLTIIGNVGADPEFHTLQNSGKEMCRFSVATTRRWRDKSSGETKEDTTWHQVVVFNEYLVGVVREYVRKGTKLYVEGESKTRSYYSNDEKKYITELVVPQIVGNIIVLGARGRGGDAPPAADAPNPGDDFDDDIPF